jgi:hypothetical protein
VAKPLPAPIASASPTPSAPASPTPTPTIDLNDPYKDGLCPARAFPGDVNRLVRALPPGGDADGDGFTNAQEINDLNFDPAADPAKFNPLIADVPRVAVKIDGNFGLALIDHLEDGTDKSLGTVNIDTTGSTQSRTDAQSKSVTDSHTVAVEVGYSKGAFSAKTSYSYTHSESRETSVSVSAEQRREASRQLSQVESQNSKNTIEGGSMIINATLSDPSDVAYVVDNMVLAVSARDVTTGRLVPFGTAVPTVKNISLAPGGAPKTLQFTLDGIGASDMRQLLDGVQAAGNLVFSVENLSLEKIGTSTLTVGAGTFDQYVQSINQNNADVTIDDGEGEAQTYLVSTSFFHDTATSGPAGTSLCDALGMILGRAPSLDEMTFPGVTGPLNQLASLKDRGGQALAANPDADHPGYWITGATSASVPDADAFGVDQVRLRKGQAAQVVYYADMDGDGVERRQELTLGSSDDNPNSDGDGLPDYQEAVQGWDVDTERVGVVAPPAIAHTPTYHTFSDPASADGDGDGRRDGAERDHGTDPLNPDTDNDGLPDGDDPQPTTAGALARYDFDAPYAPLGGGVTIPSAFGFGSSLDTCVGGSRTSIPDHTGAAGKAFGALSVSGLPCEVMHRDSPLGNDFTITGWVKIPDPGDDGYSDTWVAGVPGGIALDVQVRNPTNVYRTESGYVRIAMIQAPCDGSPGCGTPLPTLADNGPYLQRIFGLGAIGSWHFVAMSTWPTTLNGVRGTQVLLQVDGNAEAKFIPTPWPGDQACPLVVASVTRTCGGVISPFAPAQGSLTYGAGALGIGNWRVPFNVKGPGAGIDQLFLVRGAMDVDRIARIRDQGF